MYKKLELVRLLLQYRADVTITDKNGKTPLESAKGLDPSDKRTESIRLLENKLYFSSLNEEGLNYISSFWSFVFESQSIIDLI